MARGKFKCSKCDRSFSMAAHLARHVNAIHKRKTGAAMAKKRRVTARATGVRKVGRPTGIRRRKAVGTTLAGTGAVQLISSMQTYHSGLLARREGIEAEITAIGQAIEAMGMVPASRTRRAKRGRPVGRPVGRPAGRPARAGSLKTYIVKVLGQRSTAMSPKDIAARIVKAGYKSKAKDLTKAVSNTLPQLKQVKKVGFGKYKV